MASPVKTYQKEMKKFGYRATWEPNAPLEIGAVGKLHAGAFIPYTSLEKLAIPMETLSSEGEGTLEHNTEGGVKFSTKLAGKISDVAEVLGDADAGIIIEFTKENAVAFKANKTTNQQINNMAEVESAILKLYAKGKWNKDYVLVTNIIIADSTSVFISRTAGSKIELKAKGNLSPGKVDIADVDAGLTIVGDKKMETKILGAKNIVPLYKLMGVDAGFLGLGTPTMDIREVVVPEGKSALTTLEPEDDEYDLV
ncbi:hypothetical protein [Neolewinella persica]|uniref:hypothetical protein n=1 Tax=Neolewinella persica TaxID=70998 RepID=UPI00038215A6|nr:hypothetical protein [Neolewinella persica]